MPPFQGGDASPILVSRSRSFALRAGKVKRRVPRSKYKFKVNTLSIMDIWSSFREGIPLTFKNLALAIEDLPTTDYVNSLKFLVQLLLVALGIVHDLVGFLKVILLDGIQR
jgi:hypothetical protein